MKNISTRFASAQATVASLHFAFSTSYRAVTAKEVFRSPFRAFAKRFNLSVKVAFEYLYAFKGIDFLVEFYEIEHLQSIEDAVDDLIVCCANNGGTLR